MDPVSWRASLGAARSTAPRSCGVVEHARAVVVRAVGFLGTRETHAAAAAKQQSTPPPSTGVLAQRPTLSSFLLPVWCVCTCSDAVPRAAHDTTRATTTMAHGRSVSTLVPHNRVQLWVVRYTREMGSQSSRLRRCCFRGSIREQCRPSV